MKKTNTESIGNAINAYLRAMGLETPLGEYRIMNISQKNVSLTVRKDNKNGSNYKLTRVTEE